MGNVLHKDLTGSDLHVMTVDGSVNPTNLLSNGDFESWSAGAAAAPDGYTAGGAGVAVAKETTIIKMGTASASVTRSGADCYIFQDVQATRGITYCKGRTVTFGCWVYATVADRARLLLYDGVAQVESSFHTGDSTWQWLSVTQTVDGSATQVGAYCSLETGDTTAYFDGAMCVEGSSAFAFSPKPAEEGVWADYSAVSTIVGWSAFTTKLIYTKKIGKTVFVQFNIDGASDATTASITLPYTTAATPQIGYYGSAFVRDNNVYSTTTGMVAIANNSNILAFYKDAALVATAWTASNNKAVYGTFIYEAA